MATQCDTTFNLMIYYYKRGSREKLSVNLTQSLEKLLQEVEHYSVSIHENTTYELGFSSKDTKARLYIEGIEGVEGAYYDTQREQSYILPSDESVVWFRWDVSERGMVPGNYYIKVACGGNWYYAILKIEPKHMENEALNQMKEEVETFLSKWKTLPIGIRESIEAKSFDYQNYNEKNQIELLMQWHCKIIAILSDFKKNPYEQIEKTYHYGPKEQSRKSDPIAIRRTLKQNRDFNKVVSYTKSMSYETQENKWVKSFNERLLKWITQLQQNKLEEQQEEVLKKVSTIGQQLKCCQWYQNIECKLYEELPIRSRYDSRYRTLFQFEHALRQGIQSVGLKRTKAYLWLETAWIYELWCFQKVYQQMIQDLEYKEIGALASGFVLAKGERVLKLHYDTVIPIHTHQTNKSIAPLYARSPIHRRPDGRIDIYHREQYCGSIVLEFKYSNYYHIWNDNRETRCSQQLLHYGYQLGSSHLENSYHLPEHVMQQMNPIHKVMVMMPKLKDDVYLIEDKEVNVVQVALSPTLNNRELNHTIKTIVDKCLNNRQETD